MTSRFGNGARGEFSAPVVSWPCHSPRLVTGPFPAPVRQAGAGAGRAGIRGFLHSPRPCPLLTTRSNQNSPRPPPKLTTAAGKTHHGPGACQQNSPRRSHELTTPAHRPQAPTRPRSPTHGGRWQASRSRSRALRNASPRPSAAPIAQPDCATRRGDCATRLRNPTRGLRNRDAARAPAVRGAQSRREYCAGGCRRVRAAVGGGRRRRCAAFPEPLRNGLSAPFVVGPAAAGWGCGPGAHSPACPLLSVTEGRERPGDARAPSCRFGAAGDRGRGPLQACWAATSTAGGCSAVRRMTVLSTLSVKV